MVKKGVLLAFFCLLNFIGYSQLFTKESTQGSLDSLVHTVFISPNVQIMNVKFHGYSLPLNDLASKIKDIGYFNSTNSTVGLKEGIALTGGFLAPPYGLGQPANINADYADYWGKFTPGDSILDSITYLGNTIDAAILEFDFIPNGDSIKFNYVFASDEYPYQICRDDNDVFAFHISGPGIIGKKNIALIPNTNFPISINTVNDTTKPHYPLNLNVCPTFNYPQYYVDHMNDSNFIFNGSTSVLTAKEATIPCETYHLRFAIAEGGGSPNENSIVFLEANSFNSEPLKIESNVSYGGNDTVLFEGCGSAQIIFRRTYNLQQSKSYNIRILGSAQNGIDYNTLPSIVTMSAGEMFDTLIIYPTADFTPDNLENIIFKIGDTLCNGQYFETEIELVINEKPDFSINISPESGIFCDSTNFSSFITGAIRPLQYNWNNGLNFDSTLSFFPNIQEFYTHSNVTLNIKDACGNIAYDTSEIIFSKHPIADFTFTPNFSDLFNPIVELNSTSSLDVIKWQWDFDFKQLNDHHITYHFLDTGNYEVHLLVENQFDCKDSIVKIIRINEIPTLYIPNSFTPNNDGINDVFQVLGNEIVEFELFIFNRWGKIIFHSNSQNDSWSGNNYPVGNYSFTIQVTYRNNKIETKNGHVLLLK
jgi:gliding motility-associated-like protein